MSNLDKYDIVIGLEIHAELNTATKAFCRCKNAFSKNANENVCPVCLGLLNAPKAQISRAAVEKTIAAGLATECNINDFCVFERKHYFYPDLSGGYQRSQLEKPICINGGITLKNGKRIRINRIHLEEDAGKLLHDEVNQVTLCDFNRAGTSLIELVTEPDISSAAEACEFLEEVRSRYIYANVANCKMEEGGMRCDVNISIKPKGSAKLGTRVEMKNINSFKMVMRAVEYESNRQANVLAEGGKLVQETRKWNDASGKTTSMRTKAVEADYRYFPDPDCLPIRLTDADVSRVRSAMPPLAHELRERFISEYGLPEYDADVLTRDKAIADFYLECVAILNEPKQISNWIMVDLMKIMNDGYLENPPVTAKHFTEIIKMVLDKTITKTVGLQLLDEAIKNPAVSPAEAAKKMGLLATVSETEIAAILDALKAEKPNLAADYAANPQKVLPFIIGQVMKQTRGRAKSETVEKVIADTFK